MSRTRFEQEHARRGTRRQPVCQHAARRTGADDDDIETFRHFNFRKVVGSASAQNCPCRGDAPSIEHCRGMLYWIGGRRKTHRRVPKWPAMSNEHPTSGTKTLHGVIAAIATAVDDKGEPDCARSTALARFLLDTGCDGLNVLGTTGEATSFSLDQRRRVMTAYAETGLPLDRMMVGTGAAAVADAIALTKHAAELGFAGALVLPPFYYKGVHDDGLVAYIDAIVTATAARPIPIYLYHFPAQSGLHWHVALIRRLLDTFGERIVGLEGFLRRHGLCARSRGHPAAFQGFSLDRSGAAGGAIRPVRRLHLGDRQSQCRPLRARLSLGRRRGARRGGRDPQTVRRQAAGSRRQGAARPYPRRRRNGRASSRRYRRFRRPTAPP